MKQNTHPFSESELEIEKKRVRKDVYKRNKHKDGFQNSENLANWWVEQLISQQACCDYCKTSIKLIKELIDHGFLQGRRTRGTGQRGPRLELERKDHKAGYNPLNCVLICYYCNNDKSNVYSQKEYIQYLAPAKNKHFLALAEKLPKNKIKAA